MMNRTVKIAVAAFLSLSVMESAAKVTLPQIYTDNMVVQQKDRAPFHGKASPGSTVWIAAGWLKHQVSGGMWCCLHRKGVRRALR